MLLYCLKCRKDMENKNPRVEQPKNNAFIKMCSV